MIQVNSIINNNVSIENRIYNSYVRLCDIVLLLLLRNLINKAAGAFGLTVCSITCSSYYKWLGTENVTSRGVSSPNIAQASLYSSQR